MTYTFHYRVLNPQDLTRADRLAIRLLSNSYALNAAMMAGSFHVLGLDPQTLKGSCTLPDERLAGLAFETLIEMSRETNAAIGICDDGRFFFLPVLLRGGRAGPWLEEFRARWADRDTDGLIAATIEEKRAMMALLGRNGVDPFTFRRLKQPAAVPTYPSPATV